MRSLVRWAGSKQKLLPHLAAYWRPTDSRYLEAFAGSASLFFHLGPTRAALNDLNQDLIHAYRILRENPEDVFDAVADIPATSASYYRLRATSPASMGSLERAARFFFLNRYCFNGIYRTNTKGIFNVPFADHGTGGIPPKQRWLECAHALARTTLCSQDFGVFLDKRVKKGDFVYLDPPYAVSNRRVFAQYSAQTFGLDDIARLRAALKEIDCRGATFLVSYALSPETKGLARGWHVETRRTQRNIAGFARHRRRAMEVLISNRVPLAS